MQQTNTPNAITTELGYKVPVMKLCLVRKKPRSGKIQHLRNAADAEKFLKPLQYASEEYFVSLHLNARHEIIGLHEVSHGTLCASLIHPREVFKAAILANSYAVLFCHNHPSGSVVVPSTEDLDVSNQLLKAGKLIGIHVIDHLIISPSEECYSIRENHPYLWQS